MVIIPKQICKHKAADIAQKSGKIRGAKICGMKSFCIACCSAENSAGKDNSFVCVYSSGGSQHVVFCLNPQCAELLEKPGELFISAGKGQSFSGAGYEIRGEGIGAADKCSPAHIFVGTVVQAVYKPWFQSSVYFIKQGFLHHKSNMNRHAFTIKAVYKSYSVLYQFFGAVGSGTSAEESGILTNQAGAFRKSQFPAGDFCAVRTQYIQVKEPPQRVVFFLKKQIFFYAFRFQIQGKNSFVPGVFFLFFFF